LFVFVRRFDGKRRTDGVFLTVSGKGVCFYDTGREAVERHPLTSGNGSRLFGRDCGFDRRQRVDGDRLDRFRDDEFGRQAEPGAADERELEVAGWTELQHTVAREGAQRSPDVLWLQPEQSCQLSRLADTGVNQPPQRPLQLAGSRLQRRRRRRRAGPGHAANRSGPLTRPTALGYSRGQRSGRSRSQAPLELGQL
jgi:hypothetical protein